MPGWLGRIVVSLVVALISFIAYSSQIFIIWPWYGSVLSIELLVLLVPFKSVTIHYTTCWSPPHCPFASVLVGLLFWNYYLCVTTNPGRAPSDWACPPTTRIVYYSSGSLRNQIPKRKTLRSRSLQENHGTAVRVRRSSHHAHIIVGNATNVSCEWVRSSRIVKAPPVDLP